MMAVGAARIGLAHAFAGGLTRLPPLARMPRLDRAPSFGVSRAALAPLPVTRARQPWRLPVMADEIAATRSMRQRGDTRPPSRLSRSVARLSGAQVRRLHLPAAWSLRAAPGRPAAAAMPRPHLTGPALSGVGAARRRRFSPVATTSAAARRARPEAAVTGISRSVPSTGGVAWPPRLPSVAARPLAMQRAVAPTAPTAPTGAGRAARTAAPVDPWVARAPDARAAPAHPAEAVRDIDRAELGRWMSQHLADAAMRPPAGMSGVDERLTPLFAGMVGPG